MNSDEGMRIRTIIDNPLSNDSLEFLKQLSIRSYLNPKELEEICRREGASIQMIEDKKTDGQVLILNFENYTVLAFRGSEFKRKDWITNFKLFPRKTPLGYAHCGFVSSFERLWPSIKQKMDSKQVIITGHSLGGALAQICGLWCYQELEIKPICVVTFGQPRVGFFEIAKHSTQHLGGVFFRIQKLLDPVPHAPPWLFFYKHSSESGFKRISNGSGIPQSLFDRQCWNFATLVILTITFFLVRGMILSHSLTNY